MLKLLYSLFEFPLFRFIWKLCCMVSRDEESKDTNSHEEDPKVDNHDTDIKLDGSDNAAKNGGSSSSKDLEPTSHPGELGSRV